MGTFVTIAVYDDVMRARLARSLLESAGIFCHLGNENLCSLNPVHNYTIGLDLQVLERDAQTALALLRGDGLPEPGRAETEERCPRCGSADIRRKNRAWIVCLLAALFGTMVPAAPPALLCGQCGHKWK